MALLNFKYGKHGNLPVWSQESVGTVFVTTDEQAMHIDLPDGRVVISQIINVASVTEWQNMKPPYSTQAFYYIADANALLKYTGDGETNHSWKQINSTADIQSEIDSLRKDLGTKDADGNWTSGLGQTVSTHTTEITTIKDNITQLQKEDEALAKSIQDVANKTTDVEALVHTLEGVVGYSGVFETEEAAKAATEANEVCFVGDKIMLCYLDGNGNKAFKEYTTVVNEIETLKSEVEELQSGSATNADITDLKSRVDALETWKETTSTAIGTPATDSAAATGLYLLIENAQTAAENAQTSADTAQAAADKANAAIGNDGADGNDKTGLYAEIETNKTNIATNAGNIATNAEGIATNADNIATNAEDIDKLEGRADTAEQNIGTLQTTVGDAESGLVKKTNDNAAAISDNTTAITDEVARAKAAEKENADAIASLREEVMEDIQTADAMVFKDVVATEAELIAKEATAEVGHTYKASAEFVLDPTGEAIAVHIGDLLIATGEEDATTGIIKDVTWKHVPSGYVADYNPIIEAIEDIADDNEVILALTSGVNKDAEIDDLSVRGDLGQITLATEKGSALNVSTDGAGKITFSMVWESFDPAADSETTA